MSKSLALSYFLFISFLGLSFKSIRISPYDKVNYSVDFALQRAKKILFTNPDSASFYLKNIKAKIQLSRDYGRWNYLYANVLRIKNKNDAAEKAYKKALKMFSALLNTNQTQIIYNELGDLLLKQNNCFGAINCYTENYRYLAKIKSQNKLKNTFLLAQVSNRLATIFKQINNEEYAKRFYWEAYQFSLNSNQKYFQILSHIEWCGAMIQLDKSNQVLSTLIEIKNSTKNLPFAIQKKLKIYLAKAYLNTYQLDKASNLYDYLLSGNHPSLSKRELRIIYFNKSIIALLNQNYKAVDNLACKALIMTKDSVGLLMTSKIYELLLWAKLKQGEYKQAKIFSEEAKAYKAQYNESKISLSIQFWESKKKFEELLYRDSLIRKQIITEQKSNALLQKKEAKHESKESYLLFATLFVSICFIIIVLSISKRIRIKNRELEQSLSEKEVLLKEVHHRVKNNFQIISSLLRLQTNTGKLSKKATESLVEAQNRIFSMSLVHQKIYSSTSLDNVDMKSYLEDLIKAVSGSFLKDINNLDYAVNCNGISFPLEKIVPLGLIANEVISNAIKYGKNEDGKVYLSIQLTIQEDEYILEFNDHGAGFPKNIDVENLDSLGLELINILSSQINGKWEFDNRNGAYIKITFP